ncbi:hypothetical protein DERF_006086 [Dermatophagoides farinae]|uniref:Uncharacterized protein n=1 Tax=Dermatophagoides farinae TaxID=6954 RepID=A0A922LBV9_DERFA|nr:hypothetical protein DERF_006086 [Dermatophagoides farinae]
MNRIILFYRYCCNEQDKKKYKRYLENTLRIYARKVKLCVPERVCNMAIETSTCTMSSEQTLMDCI